MIKLTKETTWKKQLQMTKFPTDSGKPPETFLKNWTNLTDLTQA